MATEDFCGSDFFPVSQPDKNPVSSSVDEKIGAEGTRTDINTMLEKNNET